MLKKFKLIENFALLFVAILIGIIVSFVAQFFMYAAKVVFNFLFYNEALELNYYLNDQDKYH